MTYKEKKLQRFIDNLPYIGRHARLYRSIHRQLMNKWTQRFVLFFIVGSILSIVLSSFEESAPYRSWLFAFNYLASFIFTIEYTLRIIAAPGQYPNIQNSWKARFRYIFSFYGLIDLIAIIPFVVIYVYNESPHVHLVVLAYILTIFKLIRYSRSYRLLGSMIGTVKDELVTAYTACGILVGLAGILIYYIERLAQLHAFKHTRHCPREGVGEVTFRGRGDIFPITPLGRLLGSLIMLIGISMIAVPTAIISSAFMKMIIEKKHKGKSHADTDDTDDNDVPTFS